LFEQQLDRLGLAAGVPMSRVVGLDSDDEAPARRGRFVGLTSEMGFAACEVDAVLERVLPKPHGLHKRVHEAMRYAIFAGGKRLRPFLVLASARLFGVELGSALRVAAAIEALHTYSLIHDDLPCMDDDDLRRGRPTTHIAFDEATAILAGDALQVLAFAVLANDSTLPQDPAIRIALVNLLAQASGTFGMAGGQALDLAAEGKQL